MAMVSLMRWEGSGLGDDNRSNDGWVRGGHADEVGRLVIAKRVVMFGWANKEGFITYGLRDSYGRPTSKTRRIDELEKYSHH